MRCEPRLPLLIRVLHRALRAVGAATLAVAAAACGGGGEDPPDREAHASLGDAGKYVGTWEGQCAQATVSGFTRYFVHAFVITNGSGNRASGTLTVYDYGTLSPMCNGTRNQSSTPITVTIDATPVAANGYVNGQADRVTLEQAGLAPATAYIAFEPGFGRFRLNSSVTFEENDVAYIKR